MQLTDLSLFEASEKLEKKEIKASELTEAFLRRIETLDPQINAYITLCAESSLDAAKAYDEGKVKGALAGLPIAVKDIFLSESIQTTCASKILKGYIPPYSSTALQKLQDQGIVLLGKLNMDEFAFGSSNESSYFGPCKNPWNFEYVPGGSSGGSAAAVSARLCLASLGTDTGGSIRQPSSLCGIVGLKPSYGRVSRYGVIAFASSLDQVGPMTQDVRDAALLMNHIAGFDPKDSTSVQKEVPDYLLSLKKDLKGIKLGLPKEYMSDGIHEDVRKSMEASVQCFQALGAEIIDVALPHTEYAIPTYYIIGSAEASSNLSRFDGIRFGYRYPSAKSLEEVFTQSKSKGFGDEAKRRIMLGTYALSAGYYDAFYLKAQKVRTLIQNDFHNAFQKVDALITPTTPEAAFKIGEKNQDPITMYLNDIFTINANLAGLPGISLPNGFSQNGLPLGLQILGKHFAEETILQIAYAFEQANDFHKKKPDL